MSNHARGESEFLAGAERYVMRLTLGALAEIENGLGLKAIGDIGGKLTSFATNDLAIVASALLRGAGFNLSPADVLKLETDFGTLMRAIQDAFAAVGLGHADSASSAPPRESHSARRDAEPQRSAPRPLAGASS